MNAKSNNPRPPDDAEAIVDEVSLLLESFGRKATPAQLLGYGRALAGVSLEAVGRAVTIALQTAQEHPPSPGQLRELALVGPGGYTARAEHAWSEFVAAVERHGGDTSVSFDDGLINATVRHCGGWVGCCEKTGEAFELWLRKDFVATYQRLCASGCDPSMRAPLMGRLRRLNAAYSDERLAQLPNVNTGREAVRIGTSRPALAGPTEAVPQLERGGLRRIGQLPERTTA